MNPHHNTGKRNAAKPSRKRVELKIPLTDYEEFERLAGGGGRILNKWILSTLNNAKIPSV